MENMNHLFSGLYRQEMIMVRYPKVPAWHIRRKVYDRLLCGLEFNGQEVIYQDKGIEKLTDICPLCRKAELD